MGEDKESFNIDNEEVTKKVEELKNDLNEARNESDDEIDFKSLIENANTRELYTKAEINKFREEYNFYNQDSDLYKEKDRDKYNLITDLSPNTRKVLFFLLNCLLTVVVATVFTVFILPKTEFFKKTNFYNEMKGLAQDEAYEVASGIHKNSILGADAISSQENSDKKPLSVPQIVTQYKSAVVTVTTRIYSSEEKNYNSKGFIGTGFILDSSGNIATNYHVIEGADEINVIFYDGSKYKARVINSDEATDLAIINVLDSVEMPGVVTIGNSDELMVGERVVAIGNPVNANFAGTVTSGIISAKGREVEIAGTKIKYIQTDAAINEGNSGGPLFNLNGEVIGINTAKLKQNGIEGIGFAVPINILKDKLQFLSKPPVYMGINAKDLTQDELKRLNITNGVIVIEVKNPSPAYSQRIMVGDIITAIDGTIVNKVAQLNEIKTKKKIGDDITLTIFRNNEKKDFTFKLIEIP